MSSVSSLHWVQCTWFKWRLKTEGFLVTEMCVNDCMSWQEISETSTHLLLSVSQSCVVSRLTTITAKWWSAEPMQSRRSSTLPQIKNENKIANKSNEKHWGAHAHADWPLGQVILVVEILLSALRGLTGSAGVSPSCHWGQRKGDELQSI